MSGAKPPAEQPAIQPAPTQSKLPRLLFIFFSILFAVWITAMIAMYVVTVYPQRYPAK